MRFIVDECIDKKICEWLRKSNHDIISIYENYRGYKDIKVLNLAYNEDRILITDDKDFGDMIYRDNLRHRGIILLRLQDRRSKVKIEILKHLINNYSDRLKNNFVVATEKKIRITEN